MIIYTKIPTIFIAGIQKDENKVFVHSHFHLCLSLLTVNSITLSMFVHITDINLSESSDFSPVYKDNIISKNESNYCI